MSKEIEEIRNSIIDKMVKAMLPNGCTEDECTEFIDDILNNQKSKIEALTKENEWVSIDDRLPICFEEGDWDGKRSDFILVKTLHNGYDVARLYSGNLDGLEFSDFCSQKDWIINDVTHWKIIKD